MEDFFDCFAVEIYGEKGWEFACYFTSWIHASGQAEIYITEGYQVRVTSPFRNKDELGNDLAKICDDHVKGLITDEELIERTIFSVSERISGKTSRDLR